ncbi:MAG: hypothetical protein J5J06_19115 [Phycisphaerae bacterium]|nr:hypothetical protein [Phycisphaerae bacterium]
MSAKPTPSIEPPRDEYHRHVTGAKAPDLADRRYRVALLILLLVLGGCRTGPEARSGRAGGVGVNRVGGYLEFVARDRRYDQDSKTGSGDTSSKETIFEENLQLEMDGYVYHPNLLDFSLAGLFGLVQSDFEEIFAGRRTMSNDEGDVLEFNAEGRFLQKKSYPGSLYARRYRSIEPRAFQPSLEVTTKNYGGTWQWINEKSPTSLQFSYTDVELKPTSGNESTGSHKNMLALFETGYRFSPQSTLSFTYRFESIEEQPFELDYDTHELTLSHAQIFGTGRQHRLDSELNYEYQRGTFNIDRFRWRETMRLQHTEDLKSWYVFELLDRTQGNLAGVAPIKERSYLGTATIEHQLYDSLTSQAYLFGHYQDFQDGLQICRYGGQVSFDYRKNNRWGRLLGNYRARYQKEDRTGGNQQVDVLDERGTFRDPEPVVLVNTNVIPGTILITAEDRVTRYQIGRDYRIRQVGDRIELERLPGGLITNGETVLIDYVFEITGNFELDTIDQAFAVRQQFEMGLEPYYRFRKQDQGITPKDATGVTAEDIIDHIVGLEYRKGVLHLQAEYESYDSNITPQRAIRLNGGITKRFSTGAVGDVKARWSRIDRLPPDDRQTRFFTIEGRYRHPITRDFLVESAVLYRNEKDSLTGRDEGIDVDLSLEWSVRDTDVRVTYEYGRFDDNFTNNENSALYVQVRRRF